MFVDINFFQVTTCFPQDIMDFLFESILMKECQHLIKYCLAKGLGLGKILTLNQVNQFMSTFDCCYHDLPSKPLLIEAEQIHQRVSLMLRLCQSLPLLIAQYIF